MLRASKFRLAARNGPYKAGCSRFPEGNWFINVACVTNDQGSQLVVSKMVLQKKLPLAQIQRGMLLLPLRGSCRNI
ncbi:hypothetical protein HQN89_34255 [Paenibacillus frigoriresistens]|uniref:hypothetical protein n=1 Tax=Paenibacillus alginolyticus TaxID=59839 RepID=UPI0015636F36|nr:hypothetical protein [Paenibacillus frigoriresistens]NRF95875.1 hypothetical protein [Paenibacillus frigoriresistens]